MPPQDQLTPREKEVLRLYSVGSRPSQIAPYLGIAEHTVREHFSNIRRMLAVRHIGQAVNLAVRASLI